MKETKSIYQQLYERGHLYYKEGRFDAVIHFHTQMLLLYDYLVQSEFISRIFWDLARCYKHYHNEVEASFFFDLAIEYGKHLTKIFKREVKKGFTMEELQVKSSN